MGEGSPTDFSLNPDEIRQLRETLERAVRCRCPAWLAAEREDIVQNAVLSVVRAFKRTEEPGPRTSSYLWKVAHTAVTDEILRRRRSREVGVESAHLEREPDSGTGPEGLGAATEMREAIAEGVRRLKEPRRWAVLLYLRGFSLQESARMLGWKTKRLENQRYQGLAELRKYLNRRGFKP